MKKTTLFILTAFTAVLFAACGDKAENEPANAANTAANTAAKPAAAVAAPTLDALMALEKSAYEAWKNKDEKFWDPFLTDNFVGFGPTGRMDRAAAIKWYSGADCVGNTYELSDAKMNPVGADVAYITYKVKYEGTCGGQQLPAEAMAVGVYVRSHDKWQGAFHAESPVADPKATFVAAKPAETKPAAGEKPADASTEAMMAVVNKGWDAWKRRDSKDVEDILRNDLIYISDTGQRHDRAGAMKQWFESKCEVKSVSLTETKGVSLSPDAGLLTLKGTADGKCNDQALSQVWQMNMLVKEGDTWKYVLVFEQPI